MEALKELKTWETFYYTLTGNNIYNDHCEFKDVPEKRRESLILFMKKHPKKITWVNLAEAVYLCGEEQTCVHLSQKMKSPEGAYMGVFYTNTAISYYSSCLLLA